MKKNLLAALTLAFLLSLSACSSGPETSEYGDDAPVTDEASAEAATDEAPAPEATESAEASPDAPPPEETASAEPAATEEQQAPQPTGLEDEAARKADEAALAQVTVEQPPADAPAPESIEASADSGAIQAQSEEAPIEAVAPVAAPVKRSKKQASAASDAGSESYQVQRGDTLMKIAFETYGDLFQWRKIYEQNRDRIKDANNLEPGTTLLIEASASNVTVERNGDKYLIKQGDTLGTISNDVYGTPKKWKKIWKNNKQLIRDPNRIFAGFYLYYTLSPEEREENDRRQQTGAPGPLTQADPIESSNRAPASAGAATPEAGAAGLPGGGPWVQPAN